MTPQIPPRVDYELTEAGATLRKPLEALAVWAVEHMSGVLASRDDYDSSTS